MYDVRWHWRNCRSIGLKLDLWLWPWAFGVYREEDVYGGQRGFHLGPLGIGAAYSIGSASSYGLDRFTALSEVEAVERAYRYEGRGGE